MSDELIFLDVLENIIGKDFLKSHKLKRKITKSDLFFEKDFRKYELENQLSTIITNILSDFECNYNFSSVTLYQYIDSMVIAHKIYGTRIIEFDEEQHFTPFRLSSLKKLIESIDLPYKNEFLCLSEDLDFFNYEVLKKHRIKDKVNQIPHDLKKFRSFLERYAIERYINKNKKIDGYIRKTNEFDYIGGRIAQRAYFDLLREIAPSSKKNKHLHRTIRISKNKFEKIEKKKFSRISKEKIKKITIDEIERQINYFA